MMVPYILWGIIHYLIDLLYNDSKPVKYIRGQRICYYQVCLRGSEAYVGVCFFLGRTSLCYGGGFYKPTG